MYLKFSHIKFSILLAIRCAYERTNLYMVDFVIKLSKREDFQIILKKSFSFIRLKATRNNLYLA